MKLRQFAHVIRAALVVATVAGVVTSAPVPRLSSPASAEGAAGATLPWKRLQDRIAMGPDHTCVVGDFMGIGCWGEGSAGALGYGNTNDIGDDELPSTNDIA